MSWNHDRNERLCVGERELVRGLRPGFSQPTAVTGVLSRDRPEDPARGSDLAAEPVKLRGHFVEARGHFVEALLDAGQCPADLFTAATHRPAY